MGGTNAIVMIHGMWSRGGCWRGLAGHFVDRGYRVLTPDLPYHDVAPDVPPPEALGSASLLDYADALEQEIRAFDSKAVLVGHSMGGLLAQILAARGLGSKLVCLAPALSAGMFPMHLDPTRVFLTTMLRPGFWRKPHKPSWKTARRHVFNGMPDAEARAEFERYVWESGRALFELAFWYLDRRRAAAVDRRAIASPALVMIGREDRITPIAWARAAARGFDGRARYEEIPGIGHWLLGEPVRHHVAARIERFLARH